MSDDEKTPEAADSTPSTESPSGESEPRYTKDQLTRAIQREVGKVTGKYEAKMAKLMAKPEQTTEAPSKPPDKDVRSEIDELRTDIAFRDALLEIKPTIELTARRRKALRNEFDASDPSALKEAYHDMFGSLQTTPVVAESTTEAAVEPSGEPTTVIGAQYESAAPSARPVEPSLDPMQWSRADIDAMNASGTFLENIERWRKTLPGNSSVFRRRPPKG